MKTIFWVMFMGVFGTLMMGCTDPTIVNDGPPGVQDEHGHTHDDEHGHHAHATGPHQGTIVDWGAGKYHVEFTVDHDRNEAAVYVLGTDEKTPTSIASESIELTITNPLMHVSLKPSPQSDDLPGSSSRFVGKSRATRQGSSICRDYFWGRRRRPVFGRFRRKRCRYAFS